MNCLYILETKPFLVTSLANISSHSIGCVFYFVYGFLCSEKAYKFKSHLFIFAFLSFSLEDWPNKTLVQRLFFVYSLLGVLWCHVLYLRLSAIFSWFLCIVWGNILTSLIYVCLTLCQYSGIFIEWMNGKIGKTSLPPIHHPSPCLCLPPPLPAPAGTPPPLLPGGHRGRWGPDSCFFCVLCRSRSAPGHLPVGACLLSFMQRAI